MDHLLLLFYHLVISFHLYIDFSVLCHFLSDFLAVSNLRITEIYLFLLLVGAINASHALENLGDGRLINAESIHDGGSTHHEDARSEEQRIKIFSGSEK